MMGDGPKRVGYVLVGVMVLAVFGLMALSMAPMRSQGIVEGTILSIDVQEGRRGIGRLLNVRLQDGHEAFVAAPGGLVLEVGEHIELFEMSSDWPWHREIYRFRGLVQNEGH